MALLTVAGWAGSAIIRKLVDTAFAYLGERMFPADIEAELNRLNAGLPKITTVMNVAEALKLKYPNSGVDAWLQQFKLAFQAAEDVLDELEYQNLEDMVNNRDQVGRFLPSVVGWFKGKFSCCSNNNSDMLGRLREAVRLLDQASKDVGDFYQLAPALDFWNTSKVLSRETTSILTECKVEGREIEKVEIIEWLKKPASHAHISAFCIVGAGGLGKTTLAQLISEEMSNEILFDKTIWVCVSTSFSVECITRKILEELGENIRNDESLNGLQKKLKEKVHSKKILLILDDVWNEDNMCDWEKLVAPLRFVQQGSKILLTTRLKSVVKMLACVLNVEQEYLDLRGLEEQQLLRILNKYAFHGYNPDSHKDLQKIGNEIVKKLWGSPLAAKVIGSLLNSNINFHYWERILKCDSLISLEQAKEVTDVLKLSYLHLSADLQQCFRFCSIFPQDSLLEKNKLIQMWIASGFIRQQSSGEEMIEDIGEEYFNHLLRKSFFECLDQFGLGNYYQMHDVMHELAQSVSKGECFTVDPNKKSVIPSTVEHVSVLYSEIERVFHLRNLRTLRITSKPVWSKSDPDMPFILPNGSLKETLRVLFIGADGTCELPKEIDCLIHLRYLGAGAKDYVVPSSIYKLYHLQVLNLGDFRNYSLYLGVETTGMTNLVSLRYMNLPREVMKKSRGVHKLTSLQELSITVGKDGGCHIDEIKPLKNLRHLHIFEIENVGDPIEAKNASLSEKKNLLSLSLNWTYSSNVDDPEQIIDNLRPHPSLRKLEIDHYKGHRSPSWMRDLPSLELSSLRLSGCPLWEDLPLVAQMPHLKELNLSFMNEVKKVDYSFDSTRNACPFPSLEHLSCSFMPKWVWWAASVSCNGFPNLKKLNITYCPNLANLPAMPLSLVYFKVDKVGINYLPNIYHSSSITASSSSSQRPALSVVKISNCPKLKLLNGFLQQENLDFQGMEKLSIKNCKNLLQLPTGAFGKFKSLKKLRISGCPKLVPVENQRIHLPINLQYLTIGNCGELDVTLFESASQLARLATLHIIDSATITCIPCLENAFASLSYLYIERCGKLVENTRVLNSINRKASLKIKELLIPHLACLFIEPIRSLGFVRIFEIETCSGMKTLPDQWLLQNCSTLESLIIHNASSLHALPDTMVRLTSLEILYIETATLLEQIPELPPSLVKLKITDASSLHSLPDTMVKLTALQKLSIKNATLLEQILELPLSLVSLKITEASSLKLLPDTLVRFTALEKLYIYNATSLVKIPELPPSAVKIRIH